MDKEEINTNYGEDSDFQINLSESGEKTGKLHRFLVSFVSITAAFGLLGLFMFGFQPQMRKHAESQQKNKPVKPKYKTIAENVPRKSCGIYPINAKSEAEAEFKVMWKYLESKCEIEKTVERDGYFVVYTAYK